MKDVKIEFLILKYQSSKCDDLFTQIYRLCEGMLKKRAKYLAWKCYLDEDDAFSVVNEKFYAIVSKFDRANGKFTKQFNRATRNGCVDLQRKDVSDQSVNLTFLTRNMADDFAADFLDNIIPIDERTSSELLAIERIQRKSDQPKLVAELMDLADENTRQSVSALVKNDFSFRKAAKQLGTTDKTVKKRVCKLANNFDANRMGELKDFLVV